MGYVLPVGAPALEAIKVVKRITDTILLLQSGFNASMLFTEERFLEVFDTQLRSVDRRGK
jgi:hypothetical protein